MSMTTRAVVCRAPGKPRELPQHAPGESAVTQQDYSVG
jgi:hypothetical protein